MADPGTFRFNDLPDELKLKVYEQHFLGTKIHICHWDGKKENFCFSGMVSLNLERTCKAVCSESRKTRAKHISTTIMISDEDFLEKNMRTFASSAKYTWLRNHVQALRFAFGPPPQYLGTLNGNWQKLINCLPNVRSIEINLPSTIMCAPFCRQDFKTQSAFQNWLGDAVRQFIDIKTAEEDYFLAAAYGLHELSVALKATKDNGRVKVDYSRYAVNPNQPCRSYFCMYVETMIGADDIKIARKVIEGQDIHACWHGKGEPHIVLDWESKKKSDTAADTTDQSGSIEDLIQGIADQDLD